MAQPSVSVIKLGKDLELLEKEILKPAGYELYDFGGGHTVAPGEVRNLEGYTPTCMIAITKFNGYEKKGLFSTFDVDPEKYEVKDIANAFKAAIAEGREKYPDLA